MTTDTIQPPQERHVSPLVYIGLYDDVQADVLFKARFRLSGKDNAMSMIAELVFDYLKVPHDMVSSPQRTREAVEARQISMFIILRTTGSSLKSIGKFFQRDHSTVIYACDTVKDLMDTDKFFKAKVEHLMKRVDSLT